MRRTGWGTLGIVLLLAMVPASLSACTDAETQPQPSPTTPTATIESPQSISLQLELTGEPWGEKFMQGLSGRESLEGGMLFDFGKTVTVGFQMRETLIPLSIAFIDEGGTIVDIQDMQPLSQDPYPPGAAYRYAIEANQGYFAANGIEVGGRVEFEETDAGEFGMARFRMAP